jgi:addiction module HigA family antidote
MSLLKDPSHPGEVLQELYLEPLGMSPIALARRLNVPRTRIERLVKGTTAMTPDTAFRLAHFFGTTPQYWLNMQINFDVAHTNVDMTGIEPLSA